MADANLALVDYHHRKRGSVIAIAVANTLTDRTLPHSRCRWDTERESDKLRLDMTLTTHDRFRWTTLTKSPRRDPSLYIDRWLTFHSNDTLHHAETTFVNCLSDSAATLPRFARKQHLKLWTLSSDA